MGNTELREKLRRLGLRQGVTGPKSEPTRRGPSIQDVLDGEVVDTDHGPFFLYREVHRVGHRHGDHALADLLAHAPEIPARLAGDERLGRVDLRRVAFVDTETTGLAGGTGTYAFLVGIGVFAVEEFTIHQFFMRDYHEEPALLHALGQLLDGLEAVVSFNGKSFDLPLLDTRFVMNRQPPRLSDAPHLDLLPTARRFWKYRLASCALSSLETEILGVRRTRADVPGWLIPGLYTEYARTGDAREMPRIFYHNAQDILSLVTLAARMCDLLTAPLSAASAVAGEDLYGLGRVYQNLGRLAEAEAAFALSAETCQVDQVRELAMRDLAYLLKRQERRAEALPWWERLVERAGAVYACEELAKHYEWHDEDLVQAIAWTERAIILSEAQPRGPKRRQILADLAHRQARLGRKQRAADAANDPAVEI